MIRTGKARNRCLPCSMKNKKHNLVGFKLGHGWNKGLLGYNKGHLITDTFAGRATKNVAKI